MADKALEITDLYANIGSFGLKGINLSIEKGTIMGLIGKNGAGKTTLIKTILEKNKRAKGKVLFDGIPMYGNEEIVKSKIGVVYDSIIYPLSLKPNKIVNMISPFYKEFDHNKYEELMNRSMIDDGKILMSSEKDHLIDSYELVHIDKDVMTEDLKSHLIGIKETIFGYEGLSCSKYDLETASGIKTARPSIEDIMIYMGAK